LRFRVLINGSPVWNELSLHRAMQSVEQYTYDGRHVSIVSRNASELRTWHFDPDRWTWVQTSLQRPQVQAAPSAELRLAA
jgi:hypothetical protein